MVFAYYAGLSRADKEIYRRSDRIETVKLNNPTLLSDGVPALRSVLEAGNRGSTELIANRLLNMLAMDVNAPPLRVRVLATRPSTRLEELHGLYEPVDGSKRARISVWMRTAQQKKVVAFRSFLRTLLHEFCHHLDYELFLLQDSFHTEGFFKRESHIFKQLMNEQEPGP